jgi:FkbM family methyltransferase
VSEPRKPFQLFRRDFLFGAAGGVLGGVGLTRAATAVASLELSGRILLDGAHASYAQQGEDLVVAGLFRDIGAFHPTVCSNTYLFYRNGSRGVLVEPNVDMAARCRRVRPRDATLNVGIGVTDDPSADFYLMANEQRHTFDKEVAERLQREGLPIVAVVKMPLVNINAVIEEHFGGAAPDFLSIDIEGLDYAVLKTLDFARFRPKVICAETMSAATRRHNPDTIALLAAHGYEVRGMTHPNTIFADANAVRPPS